MAKKFKRDEFDDDGFGDDSEDMSELDEGEEGDDTY
jgi:hypothetical protein